MAKYNIRTNYVEYFKVIEALKQFKKVCSPVLDSTPSNDKASLLSHSNINKEFYRRLVQTKALTPSQSEGKWLCERDIIGHSTVLLEKHLLSTIPLYQRKKTQSFPVQVFT